MSTTIFNFRKILDKETNNKYPIVLVGNMSDCNKREVSKQVAIDWAEENNLIGYYEVSAKEGINLENLFEDSVCEVMNSNNLHENVDNVIKYYKNIISKYPIKSIEDPFAEDDWNAWKRITSEIGKNVQIVGDDLFVTNEKRLKKGIDTKSANSILIKLNQ